MMDPKFAGKAITAQHLLGRGGVGGGRADFVDLDQMPDTPNRGGHHRRAQSETFFRFPELDDDIFLDDVVFDLPPAPSLSSESTPFQLQPLSNNINQETGRGQLQAQPVKLSERGHLRSLSVDADFFEGLNFGPPSSSSTDGAGVAYSAVGGVVGPARTNSMDSAMATSFEALMVDTEKKSTNADKLHELALIDPKRAKRILANRQSAARSKERKIRYTSELERKVQTLQTEATTLSAQVTILQRDTTGLTTENKELKLRLEAMEQQAHLRDALSEALREEVQQLKIAAGQIPTGNGNDFNRGLPLQFPPQAQTFSSFGNNQTSHQQPQHVRMPQSVSNNSGFSSQQKPTFLGFNPRA